MNFEVDRNNDSIRELEAGLVLVEQLLEQNPSDSELFRQLAGFWKGTRRMSVAAPGPVDVSAAERTLDKFIVMWEKLGRKTQAWLLFRATSQPFTTGEASSWSKSDGMTKRSYLAGRQ